LAWVSETDSILVKGKRGCFLKRQTGCLKRFDGVKLIRRKYISISEVILLSYNSNFTICTCLLQIKWIKMVITVYVHLFFTLPWFLLVKLWENKLEKKSFPRMVRCWTEYGFFGIGWYENYRSIYRTVYLDRSCLP
jgi:hypothetical protein